nr:PREDICTED: uncharacterized protein LOC103981484 isoform X1 [Musa acuminata subsp. malaccensis]
MPPDAHQLLWELPDRAVAQSLPRLGDGCLYRVRGSEMIAGWEMVMQPLQLITCVTVYVKMMHLRHVQEIAIKSLASHWGNHNKEMERSRKRDSRDKNKYCK